MSRTTLLIGPPGTGKTTSLLDVVDRALGDGIHPSRIAYHSFTRKASHEAISRATTRFPYSSDEFPHFRTLHSQAFRMLGLSREMVMDTADFEYVGDRLGGYSFKHQYDEITERPPAHGALGDLCLNIYSMAKAKRISVRQAWEENDRNTVSWPVMKRFALGLDRYKEANGKYDFTDFMDREVDPLDVDLFILDEGQDLTLQQWRYAKMLGATASQVYIAGDDDQAIFQWAGADLYTLLRMDGARSTLPVSYRLPQAVFELANRIAGQIYPRFSKQWVPREERGSVHQSMHLDDIDLGEKTWLLLCRNRFQMQEYVEMCRRQGVVYNYGGKWSNDSPTVKAVRAYETLRSGKSVTLPNAQAVTRYSYGTLVSGSLETYTWDDLIWPFEGRPDWRTAVSRIGEDEREYIRALRARGESLSEPGRVTISTIHGAKGGEAHNVVVNPDMSRRVYDSMLYNRAAEARVWYVAATRAYQNLFCLAPRKKSFFMLT